MPIHRGSDIERKASLVLRKEIKNISDASAIPILSDSNLIHIEFSRLSSASVPISICRNAELVTVLMPVLESAASLELSENGKLRSTSFPLLKEAGSVVCAGSGEISLSALCQSDSIRIQGASARFPALNGVRHIEVSDAQSIEFPLVASVRSAEFRRILNNVFFDSLRIAGSVYAENIQSTTSLAQLSEADSIYIKGTKKLVLGPADESVNYRSVTLENIEKAILPKRIIGDSFKFVNVTISSEFKFGKGKRGKTIKAGHYDLLTSDKSG